MKYLFNLIWKIASTLFSFYLLLLALLGVTTWSFSSYHDGSRDLFNTSAAKAKTFEQWSAAQQAAVQKDEDRDGARGWALWFTYPGLRTDIRVLDQQYRSLRRDSDMLRRRMDQAFAENGGTKRLWEELVLRRPEQHELSLAEIGSSLKDLVQAPLQMGDLVSEYLTLRDRVRLLRRQMVEIQTRLLGETAALLDWVNEFSWLKENVMRIFAARMGNSA